MAYGIKVLPKEDPYVKIAENALSSLASAGTPGAFLVDFLPIRTLHPLILPLFYFIFIFMILCQSNMFLRGYLVQALKEKPGNGESIL